jgi:hypothetical protein
VLVAGAFRTLTTKRASDRRLSDVEMKRLQHGRVANRWAFRRANIAAQGKTDYRGLERGGRCGLNVRANQEVGIQPGAGQ